MKNYNDSVVLNSLILPTHFAASTKKLFAEGGTP